MTKRLVRDPLTHFLLAGIALFVLFDLVTNGESTYDSKIINVDRDALLTFVQYRTRTFEPQVAAARLDSMSDDELSRLIADYVREEALHREAIALGLDKNDYIVKRRMIQSVEFITDGIVTSSLEVSDVDVRSHYDAHRDDYFVDPSVTFTHVFIDGKHHDPDEAFSVASAKLAELNRDGVSFTDAPSHGNRFPYFLNYVDRDPRFVASHFGPEMTEKVFALQPSDTAWQGPFESDYGLHLVMLTKKVEGRYPELSEIEAVVRNDAEQAAVAEQKDKAIQAIVDMYEVRRNFEHAVIRQANK